FQALIAYRLHNGSLCEFPRLHCRHVENFGTPAMHIRSFFLLGLCAAIGMSVPAYAEAPAKTYLFPPKAKAEEGDKKKIDKKQVKTSPTKEKSRQKSAAKAKADTKSEKKQKAQAPTEKARPAEPTSV